MPRLLVISIKKWVPDLEIKLFKNKNYLGYLMFDRDFAAIEVAPSLRRRPVQATRDKTDERTFKST